METNKWIEVPTQRKEALRLLSFGDINDAINVLLSHHAQIVQRSLPTENELSQMDLPTRRRYLVMALQEISRRLSTESDGVMKLDRT